MPLIPYHEHSFHTRSQMKQSVAVKSIIPRFRWIDVNGSGLIRHNVHVYQHIFLVVHQCEIVLDLGTII